MIHHQWPPCRRSLSSSTSTTAWGHSTTTCVYYRLPEQAAVAEDEVATLESTCAFVATLLGADAAAIDVYTGLGAYMALDSLSSVELVGWINRSPSALSRATRPSRRCLFGAISSE